MKGRLTTPEDRVLLSRFYQRQAPEAPVEATAPAVTADQTAECPPHHWALDSSNEGVCLKCGSQKQFPNTAWGAPEGTATVASDPGAVAKTP